MGATNYSNVWKNCATCDFWGGERQASASGDSVTVDSSASGKCRGFWKGRGKYGNDKCAKKLSKVPKYFGTITRNYENAKADLLIRHLVLPGHVECCSKPLINWIAENLGTDLYLNVMDQYRPEYKAKDYSKINKRLEFEEYEKVRNYARAQGFKH